MACAPPTRNSLVTPASSAAAITAGFRTRADGDDLAHAGDPRRHGGHQQRRGQRKAAARHVAADALERLDALLDRSPPSPPRGRRASGSAAPRHARCSSRPSRWPAARRRRTLRGLGDSISSRLTSIGSAQAVELLREPQQRLVAARAHPLHDARDLPLERHGRSIAVASRTRVLASRALVAGVDDLHELDPIDDEVRRSVYSTILLSGYSTMPCAPAALSFGIRVAHRRSLR